MKNVSPNQIQSIHGYEYSAFSTISMMNGSIRFMNGFLMED